MKTELALFLTLTFGFSSAFYSYLLFSDQPHWREWQSAAFMWCPGSAAIATKLILRRPVTELGLRWNRTTRYLLGVIVFPYVLAAVRRATRSARIAGVQANQPQHRSREPQMGRIAVRYCAY